MLSFYFISFISFVGLVANFTILKCPVSRVKFLFLSPVVLIAAFFLLYMVVGFNAYWKGEFYFLGVDFSGSLSAIYYASSVFFFVFFCLFLFFFRLKGVGSQTRPLFDFYPKYKIFVLFSLFFLFYVYISVHGFGIPVVHNLVMVFFNSALVVCAYSFIVKVKFSRVILVLFVIAVLFMGFRYRLIFLFLPILFYHFANRSIGLSNGVKYGLAFFAAVSVLAVVGVTRRYSEGLDLQKLEGLGPMDVLIKGIFNDTSTVLASGALIDWLGSTGSFAYFKQFAYVVNYFIPSSIYPEKLYSPVFSYVSMLTGQTSNESGVAILGVAEFYHTAGYFGILIFSFLTAFLLAHFYKRAIFSRGSYPQFVYFMIVTWFVNSLTRGYLPQNISDFLAILFGFYIIKKISHKLSSGL